MLGGLLCRGLLLSALLLGGGFYVLEAAELAGGTSVHFSASALQSCVLLLDTSR